MELLIFGSSKDEEFLCLKSCDTFCHSTDEVCYPVLALGPECLHKHFSLNCNFENTSAIRVISNYFSANCN